MIANFFSALKDRLALTGRGRTFGLFIVTSIGSRGVGIACQLLQVPIALKAMGTEAFGLWMTLSSFNYLLNFADFGVGIGVQNRITEAFSRNEDKEARTLFTSAFAFLAAMSVVLALVLIPASLLVQVKGIFGLTQANVVAEAPLAVALMLSSFCFNLPLGLAQRLAYGRQKGWLHNLSQACGNVLGLGALVVAAQMNASVGVMIAAATFPMLLANAGLLAVLMKPLGWLTPRGCRFDFKILRSLLGLGVLFSIQQVLATVMFALPTLVISSTLGAAAVTPYNLAQRLYNLFGVIQNAFMLPLWPAYAEANARGEFTWMRGTLRRSIVATLGLSVLPMALGACFAPQIIRYWVRHSEDAILPTHLLIWLLFGWNALIFLQQPFGYLLAGVSQVKRLTLYSVANALVAVPLMLWLVRAMHQEGVVLALIVAYLPLNLVGSVREAFRFLRSGGEAAPLPPPMETASFTVPLAEELTLVICTYNNARCLEKTLRHIADQQDGGNPAQLLVVDNNSSDDTAAVIARFGERLPLLRGVVEHEQGAAFARRRGVLECRTAWLGFIDDDNFLAPDWVAEARAFIRTHPRCGAFGNRNTIVWETPPDRLIRECGYAYAALNLSPEPKRLTGADRWKLPGAGLVVRHAAVLASGWTDSMICIGRSKKEGGIAGEDTEIVARIVREGWEIWFNPKCRLDHFIVARRITTAYLARLHFGFGMAEPVLRGMTRSEPFAVWAARMTVRLAVIGWRVARETPGALYSAYRREKISIWAAYFRGIIAGIRAVLDFDPQERERWLGHPVEPLGQSTPTTAVK